MNSNDKAFDAVVREDEFGRFSISGHDGVRSVCVVSEVLTPEGEHVRTLDAVLAKFDTMIATYGWTVTSITHRRDGGYLVSPVWTKIR